MRSLSAVHIVCIRDSSQALPFAPSVSARNRTASVFGFHPALSRTAPDLQIRTRYPSIQRGTIPEKSIWKDNGTIVAKN